MRYITPHDNLILYRNDGTIAYNSVNKTPYRFGKNGVLIVGLATTDSGDENKIIATPQTDSNESLMTLYRTDLLGATSVCVEMCGQGSLTGKNDSGTDLSSLIAGYRGLFFKAPVLTGNTTPVVGQRYRVLKGSVTYKDKTYTANSEFDIIDSDGNITTTDGEYALAIPNELVNKCEAFLDEEFKIKHLQKGDEPKDYYLWNEYGFEPKASLTSSDADYYGWTR